MAGRKLAVWDRSGGMEEGLLRAFRHSQDGVPGMARAKRWMLGRGRARGEASNVGDSAVSCQRQSGEKMRAHMHLAVCGLQ